MSVLARPVGIAWSHAREFCLRGGRRTSPRGWKAVLVVSSCAVARLQYVKLLTLTLGLAGLATVIYGIAQGQLPFIVAGFFAIGVAAILPRARKIRVKADETGVEVDATLIPPPDDPDATP